MRNSKAPHSFKCPKCGYRAKAVTTKVITQETREKYYQCLNLHCSSTFVTYESVDRWIVETPARH